LPGLGLLPDDLTSQQHAELILENMDDVCRQAAIRLAAKVRHVDGHPAAWLEHLETACKDLVQHLEVVEVCRGNCGPVAASVRVASYGKFIVFSNEIRWRSHDQRHTVLRQHFVDLATVHDADWLGKHVVIDRCNGVVVADHGRREAGIERRAVMTFARTRTKRCGRRAAALFLFTHDRIGLLV